MAYTKAEAAKAHASMVKTRSWLLMQSPFFGTLALRLALVPCEDLDTAGVDGKTIWYNPTFVNKLTPQELRGLMAHEVLHCVYNHMNRKQFRDHESWNIACDYAINTQLLDMGFTLPKEGIVDTEGKYKNLSAEAIYAEVHKERQDEAQKQKLPMPGWGQVLGPANPGNASAVEAEWELATRAAASLAKKAGKLPGSFLSTIDELLEPVVDWRALLWPFATNISKDDYSWSKPNRAYISEDEYLPSMYSESLGELVVIFDTSGSVNDKAVAQFWSETVEIARTVKPSKIVVIQCDAAVQSVEEIEPESAGEMKIKIKGRGGTNFAPAMEKAVKDYPEAEAILFLTDMECNSYGPEPKCPMMWISVEKKWQTPPFGEVIYMPIDEQ